MIKVFYDIIIKYIKYYLKYKSFNKIIFINGLLTLTEIFKITIITNQNIIEHCDKSIYYYFEFILQLQNNNSDLLDLSTKDAAIFCYKKFFNNITVEKLKYNHALGKNMLLITNIILSIILHDAINYNNETNIIEFKSIINELDTSCYTTLNCFYNVTKFIYKFNLDQITFINYLTKFIKIIKKYNKNTIETINNKIYYINPDISIKKNILTIIS